MTDVVLCDDHPIFADALESVLTHNGYTVKATVNCRTRIIGSVRRHLPDICLIDRHFVDGDGLEMIGPIVAASPGTKVLLLTADRDPETIRRAFEAGARGYLCKTEGLLPLLAGMKRVVNGEIVADPPSRRRAPAMTEPERLAGYLTPRERECLRLLVDGFGTRAIADRLGVSVTTVRTYVQAVLTKLGVHSRLEAASMAVRHSLLDRAG